MPRLVQENRLSARFPFRASVSYTVMGDHFHPPTKKPTQAQAVDLSDYGMRICLNDWAVEVGSMLVVRIPLSETQTSVPTLAQVQWVQEDLHGASYAGLLFMV